jgi:hypothetical protein
MMGTMTILLKDTERIVRDNEIDGGMMGTRTMIE